MCNTPCKLCGDNEECEITRDKDINNFINDFYNWVDKVKSIETKLEKLIKKTEHDIWNNTDLGTL